MPLSTPVTAIAVECSSGELGRAAGVAMQGLRNNFEDAHLIEQGLSMCGVFDGHLGEEAAAFCAERLLLHVRAQPGALSGAKLRDAFVSCDADLKKALPGNESGATATFAAVEKRDGALVVHVASAGDSRAVLWRKSGGLEATKDHRPGDPGERSRIEAAGGFVSEEFDPPRVDGQLSCSRALGDFGFKQGQGGPEVQKVTAVPETYEWQAQRGDWLIIACDGIWDVLSSEQVARDISSAAGADLGETLAEMLRLCIKKEADDNMTLLAVELGSVDEEPKSISLSAGDYLKTKDKEVISQYEEFCLRFGQALKKEMVPKAAPKAALHPAEPKPGLRFAALPAPARVGADVVEVATASAGGSASGAVQMKVTNKRSAGFYASAARALLAGKDGKPGLQELEITALGEAISVGTAVVGALLKDGLELTRTETDFATMTARAGGREVSVPSLSVALRKPRKAAA